VARGITVADDVTADSREVRSSDGTAACREVRGITGAGDVTAGSRVARGHYCRW
jgi:hypothetical protein